MTFWSHERLLEQQEMHTILRPFSKTQISCGAYEMNLGEQVYVSSQMRTRMTYCAGKFIVIPPGQFALLITEEEVRLPATAVAFISIKFSKKMNGLLNVSGFHVDPGFRGKIKYSVYNAGAADVHLEIGKPLFLMWIGDLDRETAHPYEGQHQDQLELTPEDVATVSGELASPAALKAEIDSVRRRVNAVWVVLAAMGSVGAAVVAGLLTNWLGTTGP